MCRPRSIKMQHKPQGFALFVVLVMMIVIAFLVVAAVQSYNTEMRISSNDSDRKMAMQLAESALRQGEAQIALDKATVEDIDKKDFEPYSTIAITSGASTPTYLTNQVKDYLSQDIEKPKIRIQEIL